MEVARLGRETKRTTSTSEHGGVFMSNDSQGTRLSGANQKPAYLTVTAAAVIAGVDKRTVANHVEPDATYTSIKGNKKFPLYTLASVERFRAEREAAGL
jgi:hypothetical protein